MVTGPKRADDEDGPEEFHLVIVDNGRSRLLRDPALRESLYCIRCGACLNVCPVYQRVGGHAYGWVYPGPIGSIVTPALVGLPQAKDLPNASTLCGACREACPVQINIPRMLLHLRHELAESADPNQRTASDTDALLARGFAAVMSRPILLKIARWFGRVALKPIAKGGMVGRSRLPILSRWTGARDLPAPPARSFRDIWRDELSRGGENPES
jgi:L-lactate dehydrogenase complex protein LldF